MQNTYVITLVYAQINQVLNCWPLLARLAKPRGLLLARLAKLRGLLLARLAKPRGLLLARRAKRFERNTKRAVQALHISVGSQVLVIPQEHDQFAVSSRKILVSEMPL